MVPAGREDRLDGLGKHPAVDGRDQVANRIAVGGHQLSAHQGVGQAAQAGRRHVLALARGAEVLAGRGGLEGQGALRLHLVLGQLFGDAVAAALDDGLVEQTLGEGGGEVGEDAEPSGGLAKDSHIAGVAAEPGDVGAHPFQGGLLIHDPVVAGRAVGIAQGGVGQEAHGPEPVVDGDNDHAPGNEGGSFRIGRGVAGGEGTAVDPDHDGIGALARRRMDVEVEAVFALGPGPERAFRPGLEAGGGGLAGGDGGLPRRRRLGRTPAQVSNRGRCEGNGVPGEHVAPDGRLDGTAAGVDRPPRLCRSGRCAQDQGRQRCRGTCRRTQEGLQVQVHCISPRGGRHPPPAAPRVSLWRGGPRCAMRRADVKRRPAGQAAGRRVHSTRRGTQKLQVSRA